MTRINNFILRFLPWLQTILSVVWLNNLAHTDAYFLIYAILTILSFYLNIVCVSKSDNGKHKSISVIFSVVFSICVVLANYPIFIKVRDPELIGRSTNLMVNLINTGLTGIGGVAVSYPVFRWWFSRRQSSADGLIFKNKKIIAAAFSLIVIVNLVHLFLVEYPGNLTQDTFTQISEMLSGTYSNFNTFWHTIFFQGVLSAGYFIFHDVNAAAAFFCCFQILVMSLAFIYCLVTMDCLGCHKAYVLCAFLIYLLIPYNMALMITIWKDVLFAAGCLLMVTSLLRIMRYGSSVSVWDYLIFIFGSLLFLISRTNGWVIYLVSFLLNIVVNRKNCKLLAIIGFLAAFGWFLQNPALSVLHVSGGDPVELLSVPVQQVSRVIADGCDISQEDQELLSKVVDLDEVPTLYTSWLSDPMKVELRSKDYGYFLDHFEEYRSLWIRLGLKYPWEYVKAWVDQTKGYWNAGYDYALYSETITDNPYGIEKTVSGNPVASLFRLYFGLSRHVVFFEPLHSIGLHVWITILCLAYHVMNKRSDWIISAPVLLLVLGLWFGTPVYACFRYVYPLFVCFPLILSTVLFSPET